MMGVGWSSGVAPTTCILPVENGDDDDDIFVVDLNTEPFQATRLNPTSNQLGSGERAVRRPPEPSPLTNESTVASVA